MMRDKSMDIVVVICLKLANMMHNYKIRGNSAAQMRRDHDEDYGRVNLERYVGDDDCSDYLESGISDSYLLYWSHTLNVEGCYSLHCAFGIDFRE